MDSRTILKVAVLVMAILLLLLIPGLLWAKILFVLLGLVIGWVFLG